MEKILEDFGVQPVLLLAQVVNFLILLFLLKKFLYGPMLKALETRKQKIADSLKQAEEIQEKLLKTEEDREKVLDKAAGEAKQTIDEATKNGAQIIEEARIKAQEEVKDLIAKAHEQINLDREKMQQELRSEVAELVTTGLKVVTGKILTDKDKKDLVEKSIKGIS